MAAAAHIGAKAPQKVAIGHDKHRHDRTSESAGPHPRLAEHKGIPEFDAEMETHGAKLSFRLPDKIEVSTKLSKNNIAGDTEPACADARALYDVLKAKKSKRMSIKVRK